MQNHMINTNPLINKFNGYMTQNPNTTPFQNNQLINQNVHVMNNLNELMKQHTYVQQNMNQYQQHAMPNGSPMMQPNNGPMMQSNNGQMMQSNMQPNNGQMMHPNNGQMMQPNMQLPNNTSSRSSRTKRNNKNIIEEMLKPQRIMKENKDVPINYKTSKDKRNEKIEITNAPYKNIIKDRIVNKNVKDITIADILVHKVTDADRNAENFDKEIKVKKMEKKQINNELKIEFHIDNYSGHKTKFEYKESFIKNLAYDNKDFNENREDYIEFYRKHQKDAEEGQDMCDKILHDMIDTGLIKPEELPCDIEMAEDSSGSTQPEVDIPADIPKKNHSNVPKKQTATKKSNIDHPMMKQTTRHKRSNIVNI